MLFALFNSFTVPVDMGFEPEFLKLPYVVIANYFIDFIFFVDILIAFRTVYINDRGEEVKDGRMIAMNYLKSTFIIDFLATVPFDNILSANDSYVKYVEELQKRGERQWIQIFGIMKLGRVLRLNKIIQFLKSAEDIKASLQIVKMVLFLLIYLHIYTCYWWSVVSKTENWIPPEDRILPQDRLFRIY